MSDFNSNKVAQRLPKHFGSIKLAEARQVNITTAGNAVATLTIVNGSEYIVRRITVSNANATVATGNVAVLTSSDGNTSNAVSNNVVLTAVSAAHKWVDLGLATAALSTSYTNNALYLLVNTGVAGKVDIAVYGDILKD